MKQISPSCFYFQLKENNNEIIHSCKIMSYKNGIFRIIFDDLNETKYKNKTNIGENLIEDQYSNIIFEDDRVILESIENEDFKLEFDIDVACLGHNLNSNSEKNIYRLEIITYPCFVINYHYGNKLISSLNKQKKFTQLKGTSFNPNSIDITAYDIKSLHGLPERLSEFSLVDWII
jgi:hypothetical protein